jgi:hypothetical protein
VRTAEHYIKGRLKGEIWEELRALAGTSVYEKITGSLEGKCEFTVLGGRVNAKMLTHV